MLSMLFNVYKLRIIVQNVSELLPPGRYKIPKFLGSRNKMIRTSLILIHRNNVRSIALIEFNQLNYASFGFFDVQSYSRRNLSNTVKSHQNIKTEKYLTDCVHFSKIFVPFTSQCFF